MKETCSVYWIFSVLYGNPDAGGRYAVVGLARASTVEEALHLAGAPEEVCAEIRRSALVRQFIEGALDPNKNGYCFWGPSWCICLGSVHKVIP